MSYRHPTLLTSLLALALGCNNLTAISNEISGTRWSGPAFFGLKSPKIRKASK